MKRTMIILCLLLLVLTSCERQKVKLFTRIVHHSSPDLSVDNSFFTNLGCFSSTDCLPDDLKTLEPSISFLYEPDAELGALDPSYPIAVAWSQGNSDTLPPYFFAEGCMMPFIIRYIIAVNDQIILVDSIDKLAELYAPIETPEEALSYAIAATGYSPIYSLHLSLLRRFYVYRAEETNVRQSGDSYVVHLYDTDTCGCGPHIIPSINVTVTRDGMIETGSPVSVYRDITEDNLCID